MYTSFFDVFSIGIGPSSSHTMGPMRAAARFVQLLRERGLLSRAAQVRVHLYGSLALTGEGHGTPSAIAYGLMGLDAESMEGPPSIPDPLLLGGERPVPFRVADHIIAEREQSLPEHPNGLHFQALDADGASLCEQVYFSIGGGAVKSREEMQLPEAPKMVSVDLWEFHSCRELMEICMREGVSIARLARHNETRLRSAPELDARIRLVAKVMNSAIDRGTTSTGILPSALRMPRRAPQIYARLEDRFRHNETDALTIIDWINLWAFAVAEENAAGGRVVTAPTMGSAGVLPAVLRYYERYGCKDSPFSAEKGTEILLLTASAICSLYRANASISGAEVGCQGEVGVACSMAAAGLAAAMGGSNQQVENAAEIAMEHNLGLTCDPVCGLVQVPCIERNAIGAVKAVNAARLAMRGDGSHYVSLDSVIATMYETGRHLHRNYRETSLAGLAKNAPAC